MNREMRNARQNGIAYRGVLFVLLALVAMNAITVCAAPLPAQPVHPCCPASTHSTSDHCGKLGCFMSDPVTMPAPFASADPGGAAVELPFLVLSDRAVTAASFAARPVAATELYVSYRQLLI